MTRVKVKRLQLAEQQRPEACVGETSLTQSAKKRKRYTNFSDTDRAEIDQYAVEYGNAPTQQHFKAKLLHVTLHMLV